MRSNTSSGTLANKESANSIDLSRFAILFSHGKIIFGDPKNTGFFSIKTNDEARAQISVLFFIVVKIYNILISLRFRGVNCANSIYIKEIGIKVVKFL